MIETIVATSLALATSMSASFGHNQPVASAEISLQSHALTNELEPVYLAGKPYESKYRRDVDRSHEEHNDHNEYNQHQDHTENRGGRIYRNSDRYRQNSEYEYRQDRQNRVYRDDDDLHQEVEYRRRDRSYPQGSYGNYPSTSIDRYYRR